MLEPAPGVEFGRYVMVSRPEYYGAGSLVAAREARSGARRSLWLVMPHVVDDPELRAAVIRAATALRRLASPHLVQVHEFGQVDEQPFFATGPLDGVALAQACAPDGVPPADALDLIAQIGAGVNHLHHAGLVDGALGPERVLVEEREGRVHATVVHAGLLPLLLGHSALFGSQKQEALDFGAPELQYGAEPTVRSDVYSLGCLLWLTLTGEPPFPSYAAHVSAPTPQVAGDGPVQEAVNSVLQRALAKDPEARYRDAAAFVATVRSIAALARDEAAGVLPDRLVRGVPAAAAEVAGLDETDAPASRLLGEVVPMPASTTDATDLPGAAMVVPGADDDAEPERALLAAVEHWASGRPVSRVHGVKKRRKRAFRTATILAVLGTLAVVGVWGAQHVDLLDAGGADSPAPVGTSSAGATDPQRAPAPVALTRLFPIAGKDECVADPAEVAHRIERWTCQRRGYRVVLTQWDSQAHAHALTPHGGPQGARERWMLDGNRAGTQWTWRSADGRRAYRWTAVYRDVPYAVIIEAKNKARRNYAREHVVLHPSTVPG